LHILLAAPGVSVHSQRFLQMLLDAGHIVTFVDSHNPKPEGAERYAFVTYPGMFGLGRFGLRTVNRLGHRIKAARLKSIWKRTKPDVVHVHWVDQRAYHCALAGVHPMVLTCWGSDINNLFDPNNRDTDHRARIIRSLAHADHITADSLEVRERCEQLVGRKLNSSLFYFGIDLERFRPGYAEEAASLRARLGIAASAKVILSTRRLVPLMQHEKVLRAFAKAVKETGTDAVILFNRYLSADAEYLTQIESLADSLGIGGRVVWMDGINNNEMPVVLAASDLVVNFPDRDGFPVSLFEAAACKRAVITCALKAYDRVFDGAFIPVPPNDERGLCDAIKNCLTENADQRSQRTESAFARVRAVGSRSGSMKHIEAVYEQAVSVDQPSNEFASVGGLESQS